MLIERSLHPRFLSNTYLLAAGLAGGEGAAAIFIDAGGPVAPLIAAAERLHVNPSHVLLTHHHFDHVQEVGALLERWPQLSVLIGEKERGMLDAGVPVSGVLEPGAALQVGALAVEALPTPGHTAGMLSFLVRDTDAGGPAALFTGDTLFRGSVGGVHAPGHTTFAELKRSIMEVLMGLDPQTVIYPGHADATTVAQEWDRNPFIRAWRGLEEEQPRPCRALGRSATLILLADDYDGGHKAWVRWEDGADDILPGSQVEAHQARPGARHA
ncbi:MAG TPA: MBL fold metallo-hydrolase [Solirubrobacteraceae bacterium]|nr:MBL fold metallo-hydrolase [Solirubrobacteraceae bacterium]